MRRTAWFRGVMFPLLVAASWPGSAIAAAGGRDAVAPYEPACQTTNAAPCTGPVSPFRPEPQHREPQTYDWERRHQLILERHKQTKPEVVFIGDSITHFWGGEPHDHPAVGGQAWQAMVGAHVASNLGFGWDYIDNAYYRVEHGELDGITPKVIVILLGVNNLGTRHDSPADCAAIMQRFLALLRQKAPHSKLLLLGILPSCDAQFNATILATDRLYAGLADAQNHIYYADFRDQFLPGGASAVPAELMSGVHPNAKGYEVLGAGIKAQLARMGF